MCMCRPEASRVFSFTAFHLNFYCVYLFVFVCVHARTHTLVAVGGQLVEIGSLPLKRRS